MCKKCKRNLFVQEKRTLIHLSLFCKELFNQLLCVNILVQIIVKTIPFFKNPKKLNNINQISPKTQQYAHFLYGGNLNDSSNCSVQSETLQMAQKLIKMDIE